MEQITHFISTLRWQDILDILLNSYLLFRFYVLFRGTYVFRVLVGLIMLWFFQQLAESLGLIISSWVIQGIIAVAAFIIIVIFRNEIRSVLQARNLKSILWGFSFKIPTAPIDIISTAVFELAQRKIGALLVFPGKEDLTDLLQAGVPWNGRISREMLISIFWPDNPVHDGAAVITGDQVTQVGAILPLTQQSDIPSRYGTRHRAALGLSENTDAIVIVVSEERGDIALSKHSRLREIKNRRKLKQKLQEHFGFVPDENRFYRSERFEFIAAAVVSFIFITGIWFSVSRGLDTLVTMAVPVQYMNRKSDTEIVNTSAKTLSLELSGSGSLMKSISPGQVQVKLDLNKAIVGKNTYTITTDNIALPPGVILNSISPAEVDVDLDITIEKELPVQVDWVGKLPENLIVLEARIDPERVTIIGGKRILEKMTSIYTEKVPVDSLEDKGTITANLALNPASLKIASNSKVKVTIKYITRPRNE